MSTDERRAERLATLRLVHASNVGPVTYRKLVRIFGSAEAVLAAPQARLEEVPDLGRKTAQSIRQAASDAWAEEELARASVRGVTILTLDDPAYPKPLLNTYDPPPVLYVSGELRPEDALAVAIVGTRHCSPYGRKQAERLAAGLALAGFTVVSGLARGVDTSAHQGAMDAGGGRTLAVLGTGVDHVYPPENSKLHARIAGGGGAVLSELPLGTPPSSENFPRRNRVIAGLALGTIVIEGSATSGALITARYAVDMDREVFAVPGPVDSPNSAGPHRLIKQGAKLIEDVEDVLAELREVAAPLVKLRPPDERLRLPKLGKDKEPAAPLLESVPDARPAAADLRAINLNPREQALFGMLDPHEPRGLDRLITESGLKPHEVLATLMVLEVRRLCRQLPGKRFVKA
ncbi:MAG: DNA processing protein DprA [Planctomycetota bacterium]